MTEWSHMHQPCQRLHVHMCITDKLTDLSAWERRMCLKEYFYAEDAEHRTREDEHQYKKKTSTWTPKAGRDK
ncbi:hypothetical protein DPMN_194627 [Dreissena polymorpha]|uniref:Uncharacterized protein n=1 Tax=Dreissena polymorpha TaxID=45954 RepID=A0A9D3Y109_DREPO|nr:hypothetical protein DPMN_194627 [Dreissena polymorpha]